MRGMEPNLSKVTPDERELEVAHELAASLVRAFAATDELLQARYDGGLWATPDRVAQELEDSIAARLTLFTQAYGAGTMADMIAQLEEAIDNLGRGEQLDPWDALAFRAPVGFRSHRVVLSDAPAFSDDVRAVQAQLLRRGVAVLAEEEHRGTRFLTVSSYNRDRTALVSELLPDVQVDWAGRTARQIVPARCVGWRKKADDVLRVWIALHTDEHIDEVVAAENDDEVVVLAFACTPTAGSEGGWRSEPIRVDLDSPIGDRQVICGFSGEVLRRESGAG